MSKVKSKAENSLQLINEIILDQERKDENEANRAIVADPQVSLSYRKAVNRPDKSISPTRQKMKFKKELL